MLSIQAGENPPIIEEKLKAFLPPKIGYRRGRFNGREWSSDGKEKIP